MWLKEILLLVFVGILLYAITDSKSEEYTPKVVPELSGSVCKDSNGNVVLIRIAKPDEIGDSVAQAVLFNNSSIILVNDKQYDLMYRSYMYSAIKLVLLHECGHVYLGHTINYKEHSISKESKLFAERNADCLAAYWMNKSDGIHRLNTAISDLTSLKKLVPDSPRIHNMQNCAKQI